MRLFAYGALSVVLAFHLTGLGLSEAQTGLLFTLTLLGDTLVSLWLTTVADRLGRRRTLIAGALLMAGAGTVFAMSNNYAVLVIAGMIGVISPSGGEVGPFLPVEQAGLTQVIPDGARTRVFAWYTLAGSMAAALGSLCGGLTVKVLGSYQSVVILYAVTGLGLVLLFQRLTPAVEASAARDCARVYAGVGQSRGVVLKLSALFALDAFGGGFVVQSLVAYWFFLRFGVEPAALGAIFFGANVFAGISALLASRLSAKIGLVRTMVFTHLPSNVLLMLLPMMPNTGLAIGLLLARFSISQMDVPTRQSYVMAVVRPEERSAAAGITGVARTTGAAISPWLSGLLLAQAPLISVPFFLAGGVKIFYDLLLYRAFVKLPPPEERGVSGPGASEPV